MKYLVDILKQVISGMESRMHTAGEEINELEVWIKKEFRM